MGHLVSHLELSIFDTKGRVDKRKATNLKDRLKPIKACSMLHSGIHGNSMVNSWRLMALFMNVVGLTADRIQLFFKVWGDGAGEYSKDARHGAPRTRSEKHRIGDIISKNRI